MATGAKVKPKTDDDDPEPDRRRAGRRGGRVGPGAQPRRVPLTGRSPTRRPQQHSRRNTVTSTKTGSARRRGPGSRRRWPSAPRPARKRRQTPGDHRRRRLAGRGHRRRRGLDRDRAGTTTRRPTAAAAGARPRPCACTWTPDRPAAAARSRTSAPRRRPRRTPAPQTMTINTNLGPITAERRQVAGAVHRRQLRVLAEQELLRQHQVPPPGHRGHQGAAVRRPERHRQGLPGDRRHGRPELHAGRGEPADRQATTPYPAGVDRDGQHRPAGQHRQPVLHRLRRHASCRPSYTLLGTVTAAWTSSRTWPRPATTARSEQAGGGHPKKEVDTEAR